MLNSIRLSYTNLLESNVDESRSRAARPAPTLLGEFKTIPKLLSCLLLSLTMLTTIIASITTAHAALTATTANVIQGRAPWFSATSEENKLGFTLQGTYYSERASNISSGTAKEFNVGLTLSDFAIKQLVATDFTESTDYSDSDGDGAATVPFTMGTVSYEWRENGGALISSTDYGKTLGCGSGLSMPLTLKLRYRMCKCIQSMVCRSTAP